MVLHLSGTKGVQCYVSPIANADHIVNNKIQILWQIDGELGNTIMVNLETYLRDLIHLETQINFETSLFNWKLNLELWN